MSGVQAAARGIARLAGAVAPNDGFHKVGPDDEDAAKICGGFLGWGRSFFFPPPAWDMVNWEEEIVKGYALERCRDGRRRAGNWMEKYRARPSKNFFPFLFESYRNFFLKMSLVPSRSIVVK